MSRVLFVSNIPPWPPYGGQYIRTYNLLDSLSRIGSVAVLAPPVAAGCPLRQTIADWYEMPAEKMRVGHLGLWRRRASWAAAVTAALRADRPDIVWFDYTYWGAYYALARRQGAAVIAGRHNFDPEVTRQRAAAMPGRLRRGLGWLRYQAERRHERIFLPQVDCLTVVSRADQARYRRCCGDLDIQLLPNYINESWYEADIDRDMATVVITANFGSFQNWYGADWFLRQVWPRLQALMPAARLQLVGQGAAAFASMAPNGVELVGEVPQVAPYLRQGTVAAVPLRHGGGTRFKILEAFAAEIPVVSTTLGAEGLDVASGQEIILADDAAAFAAALANLLAAPAQRAALTSRARRLLQTEYGFAVNTGRLAQILERVAAQRRKGA